MNGKLAVVLFELGVLVLLPPLFADELRVEVTKTERVSFAPRGTIRVNDSYGYLSVEGWDQPEVEVTVIKSTDRFYKPSQQEDGKQRVDLIRVVTDRHSETEWSITTIRASRHGTWSPPLPPTTKAGVTVEIRIRAPRDSRLVIHHDTGFVLVNDIVGDIEATSHSGDMILMLPSPGPYSIDAKNRLGAITSDFEGAGRNRFVLGARFASAGTGATHRVFLRMGHGGIAIQQVLAH